VYRYLTDGTVLSRVRAEQWIARTQAGVVVDGMGLWMLEESEGHLAGSVSLEMQRQPRSAELTYLLHPRYWGQGLATRMSWTVMQRAFESGHVDQIVAGADTPNTASVAVMRRLGMQFLRTVQYPLGPGVEYVYRRDDSAPVPLPTAIPFIE
jgi:RimJ/RimL family protein N-acetyltransferase